MSTTALRRACLATAVSVTAALLISGPAAARPLSDAESHLAATSGKRAFSCSTLVTGVLPSGKGVQRIVKNRTVPDEIISTRALPFRPSATSFLDSTGSGANVDNTYLMLDPQGSPRQVTFHIRDAGTEAEAMTFTTKKLLNPRFPAKLYTGSASSYVFTVSRAGVLKRWMTYQNRAGRLFYDDPVTIRKGLRSLTTLQAHARFGINGRKSDVMYATTKSGALQQIRVPVNAPTKESIVTVKRRGFDTTTAMSLSYCNDNVRFASIIAIDAKNDSARWYTLSKSNTPRARNLTFRGTLPSDVSWRLHATL